MKKIVVIAILFAVNYTSFSQSSTYQDLALIFSQNDENGSARFTGMSGAFGALGGDISSVNINPAGISVFKNSSFSGTFNSRNSEITSNYYGNSLTNKDHFFNLSHAGAVFVFNSAYNSEWSKFAVGFNYRIKKDFNKGFLAEGNSGVVTFDRFPLDKKPIPTDYKNTDKQRFINKNAGEVTELSMAFSSVHRNKLHVGLALNFYSLDFSQQAILEEYNNDGNGNKLDVELYQENITKGNGFSVNTGFIYKANHNFRFGLAYQTPTWYTEVLQNTNFNQDNDDDIGETVFHQGNETLRESNPLDAIAYKLKTPSKLTASAAFIFGKSGLLSIDYSNKNYKGIKLSDGVFTSENQFFQNELRNTHSFNVGTEWRVDRFSIRGGYKFEQSPDKLALDTDNLEGYSFGGGYNFGGFKIDLAFSDNNRTGLYDFYPQFDTVNAADLTLDNKTITATLTFNL